MSKNAIWMARRIPSQSKEVVKDGEYFQVLRRTRSYILHVGGISERTWHAHILESVEMEQMFPAIMLELDIYYLYSTSCQSGFLREGFDKSLLFTG